MDLHSMRKETCKDKQHCNPQAYNLALKTALLHMQNGDTEASIAMFKKAVSISPGDWRVSLLIAWQLFLIGSLAESEKTFSKTLSANPDNVDILRTYAIFLLSTNHPHGALRHLKKAEALDLEDATIQCDLGYVHYILGDYNAAERHFRKALSLNPGQRDSLLNLGLLMTSRGSLAEAQDIRQTLKDMGYDEEYELLHAHILDREKETSEDSEFINFCFAEKIMRIAPFRMQALPQVDLEDHVGLSVIIPIKDEEDNIPILYGEIKTTLKDLDLPYEIILIDDGSEDGSLKAMQEIADKDHRVRVVVFRRNYGQTAALSAGFKVARGEVVITLDGDLQNDPADIPLLLDKMSEGFDMVCGWRKARKDRLLTRRLPSMAANRIINWLISGTGVHLHDFGCSLKAYKLDIVKNIKLYGEMHRFIPVFSAWLGVRVAEVEVNHRPRTMGVTKYNLSRIWKVLFDLLPLRFFSDYMTRPIHFFGKLAKYLFAFGVLSCLLLGAGILVFGMPSWCLNLALLLGMFGIGSLSLICMGMIGEILIRIYFETKDKEQYVIERIIDRSTA